MLLRAAARSLPFRPVFTTPLPLRPASIWYRTYAHFDKPRGKPTSPGTGSGRQTPSKLGKRPTDFTNHGAKWPVKGSEHLAETESLSSEKENVEFNEQASPEQNTAPEVQPGPDGGRIFRPDTSRVEGNHLKQEEFEGPKDAAENATPNLQPNEASPGGLRGAAAKPLPDLRQGIPSTFAEEFLKPKRGASTASGLDDEDSRVRSDTEKIDEEIEHAKEQSEAQQSASGRSGAGSELPRSAYETSTDRRRNRVMNYTYLSILVFAVVGATYLGRNWDNDEEEKKHLNAPSGWNLGSFWARIKARVNDSMGYYTEPTFPKLLPTMDPAPPYTLVLSLEDLMIHSEWTRQHGYRTAKRPGLDYFIRYLSQYYEIVMFTSLPMAQAEPVYRKLDPYHIIMWPLFREATRYHNGDYIKDLSYLNRDLSKVIILDTKAAHTSANSENAIILSPWKGDPTDRNLVSYIPFLENIAAMGYPDVRKAIKSFEGKEIPAEFARREAELRAQFNKQLEETRGRRPRLSVGGLLTKGLGLKAQPAPGSMILGEDGQTASEGFDRGLMLSDQIRERGRKAYEQLESEIRLNGEKWLKEMEEEEKKMQEESMRTMKGNVGGAMGWFGGSGAAQQSSDQAASSAKPETP